MRFHADELARNFGGIEATLDAMQLGDVESFMKPGLPPAWKMPASPHWSAYATWLQTVDRQTYCYHLQRWIDISTLTLQLANLPVMGREYRPVKEDRIFAFVSGLREEIEALLAESDVPAHRWIGCSLDVVH